MPVFLLLFAGLVFISKLYLTKIQVMREARLNAWDYASANCGKSSDSASSVTSDLGTASSGTHAELTAGGLIRTKSSTKLMVNVSATRTVMCNEPPYDGDLAGMAHEAIHILLEAKDEAGFLGNLVGGAVKGAGHFLFGH
jgi:hypothetical protein